MEFPRDRSCPVLLDDPRFERVFVVLTRDEAQAVSRLQPDTDVAAYRGLAKIRQAVEATP